MCFYFFISALEAEQNFTNTINVEVTLDADLDQPNNLTLLNESVARLNISTNTSSILSENITISSSSLEDITTSLPSALSENITTVPPGTSQRNIEAQIKDPSPCPIGFIRYKNSCYHIIGSGELTWSIANTYCQLHGSKLVEIETENEQRFIQNLIKARKGKIYRRAVSLTS